MRRARRVIAFLLILSAAVCLPAQQSAPPSAGSVDTDVTVMGRDDSTIPVPEPQGDQDEIALPLIDPTEPDAVYVPPVLPPVADSMVLPPIEALESAAPSRSTGR